MSLIGHGAGMDIQSPQLAPQGANKIAWAEQAMPVLRSLGDRFERELPLRGRRIAACLHVTAETGALMRTLHRGGAAIRLCASNPLSTQDDVAAALVDDGIAVYAIEGEDRETYFRHLRDTIDNHPHLVMDDGADLTTLLHTDAQDRADQVIGGTEETTTGVTRLRAMQADGVLQYPVFAINDAQTKHMFDNGYGTGQSTIDGILRATNRLLAGSRFVVCGYGWCGRGIASRAQGMGAHVIVTEVDPVRALEAVMDGFEVLPIEQAAAVGQIFCTATGGRDVIGAAAFATMRDGALVANAGHFDVELDLKALSALTKRTTQIRDSLERMELNDGRNIYVLAEGRLVNLSAAEGHPADVMDLSFANQALCIEHLATAKSGTLAGAVHGVPSAIDRDVAALKLGALGVDIDVLSAPQRAYQEGWRVGT